MISVVVPVFNGAAFVAEAIDSIFAQPVAQPIEVIVVDDASTDDTLAVLAAFGDRIRVLARTENGGAAVARNVALAAAHGDVIAFLDADDLWTDRHLPSLLPLLDDPACDCARGCTRIIALDDPDTGVREVYQPILLGAGLYRRAVFDKVGLFDERLRVGQDFDMAARIAEAGIAIGRTPEIVLVYRRHASATVAAESAIRRGQFDSIRRRIERRPRA